MLKSTLKALAGIALVTFLSTSVMSVGLSATSNELRESIGLPPNSYGDPTEYTENTGEQSTSEPSENFEVTVPEEDELIEEIVTGVENQDRIEDIEGDIAVGESKLLAFLGSDTPAISIINAIEQLEDNRLQLSELTGKDEAGLAADSNKSPSSDGGSNAEDSSNSDTESSKVEISQFLQGIEQKDAAGLRSLDYDIGPIGDAAISVVEGYTVIETPYGFTKPSNQKEYTESKLLGMDLAAEPGERILSQWNGVITQITQDNNSKYNTITVYHGNSTYTIYNHVVPAEGVAAGQTVRAGSHLGNAASTVEIESEKANHIFYQIELNGEYINPILIYGSYGKTLYESWLTSHSCDNIVEAGEKYYNDLSESEDNQNEDKSDDIINSVPEIVF